MTVLLGGTGKLFKIFLNKTRTTNIDHIVIAKDYLDRTITYWRDNVIWKVTGTTHWLV